jgi:Flp pilus assembly protein CpaB
MNYSVRNIVIAVSLAACAIVAVLIYTSNVQSQSRSGSELVKVQQAAVDIPAGTTWEQISKGGMLHEVDVAKTDALPGALTSADLTANRFAGDVANQEIFPGEQVPAAIFQTAVTAAPSLQLQGNERAIQIAVDTDSGIVGTLHDGDHVDVLESIKLPNASGQTIHVTRRLLTNVQVLKSGSTGTTATPDGGSGQTHVLLKVSDTDAVRVLWVTTQDNSGLYLVVRPKAKAQDSALTVPTVQSMILDGLNHKQAHDVTSSTGSLTGQ